MRCLENDGHEVQLLDIYGNDLLPFEVEDYLDHHTFDCVCISGFASYNYAYVLWLAGSVKKRYAVPVVIGGLLADLHYNLLLSKDTIDLAVIGEGENIAVDLFRHFKQLDRVKGIAYKRNGQIELTDHRELIENLDTLPMPNFSLWNMDRYLQSSLWADDASTRYGEYEMNLPPFDQLHPNMAVFLAGDVHSNAGFAPEVIRT